MVSFLHLLFHVLQRVKPQGEDQRDGAHCCQVRHGCQKRDGHQQHNCACNQDCVSTELMLGREGSGVCVCWGVIGIGIGMTLVTPTLWNCGEKTKMCTAVETRAKPSHDVFIMDARHTAANITAFSDIALYILLQTPLICMHMMTCSTHKDLFGR